MHSRVTTGENKLREYLFSSQGRFKIIKFATLKINSFADHADDVF